MAAEEDEESEMRRAMSSLSLSGDARDADRRAEGAEGEGGSGAPDEKQEERSAAEHGSPGEESDIHVVVRSVSARVRPRSFNDSESGSVRSAFDDGVPCKSEDAAEDDSANLLFEKFVVVGIGDETDSASDDGCGLYEPEIVTSWPLNKDNPANDDNYGDIALGMPEFAHFCFGSDSVEVWKNTDGMASAPAIRTGGKTPFIFLLRVPGTSVALWVRPVTL